ncbi:hypothetical protein D3C84_409160 [compost metagenome]
MQLDERVAGAARHLQLQIRHLELRGLSGAGSGVVQEQQQRMVTDSLRRLHIRCSQECVHLWLLQVRDLRAGKLPERNRENAPRPFQVFRAVLADEAGKRVQRCQTLVDGPRGEVLVTRR